MDWLIEGLKHDIEAHRSLLSCLILQALLSELNGANKIDVASRILAAVDVSSIGSVEEEAIHDLVGPNYLLQVLTQLHFVQDSLNDAVAKSIVVKPSSQTTGQKAQLALLLFIATIDSPASVEIDWFAQGAEVRLSTKHPDSSS